MSRFSGWNEKAVARLTGEKIVGTKPNKYKNVRTEYGGIKYDSKFEAEFAQKLDLMKICGQIKSWRRQVPFNIRVEGKNICKYIIDFEILHNDGKFEYIEIKGVETAAFKLKRKLFLQTHGNIRYRVIKRDDKK
jgi:hypothetical protein